MQTKLSSLHFMVFIKGPRKGKEKKDRDRGRKKHPQKNFTTELRKFAKVMKNSKNAQN